MSDEPPILTVSLLVLPESSPGALYCLHELLGLAGRTWQPITGEPEVAKCRFAPRMVSVTGKPAPSPAGPMIAVEAPLHAPPEPDILIGKDGGQGYHCTIRRNQAMLLVSPPIFPNCGLREP